MSRCQYGGWTSETEMSVQTVSVWVVSWIELPCNDVSSIELTVDEPASASAWSELATNA
jgi:hypothetical protein